MHITKAVTFWGNGLYICGELLTMKAIRFYFGLLLCLCHCLQASDNGPKSVGFSEHVAPIIFNNCTSCHRPGESAPFSLRNYGEVKKRGRLIARVTVDKVMPPWHAESADYEFEGQRLLTDKQISIIGAWVNQGMKEGNTEKLPQMPAFTKGWQLGEPDLVLTMKEEYPVPAVGRDVYRSFVIPLDFKKDKWIKAIEFIPSSPEVVHHSLFRYDTLGWARKLDSRSKTPGFTGMGEGEVLGPRSLGGWGVGGRAKFLPGGLAYRLPSGADFIMDMHFHLSGKPEKELSKVGIYFADNPPKEVFTGIQMPPEFGALSRVSIPPGDSNYTIEDSFVLPVDLEAFSVSPHAHYLGKEMKMTATFKNGDTKTLLWIKNWDFSWQEQYNYKDFISLPKGTRLDTKIVWDNSAENPNNPHDPPRRVSWGLQSSEEMGSVIVLVKPRNEEEMEVLHRALKKHAGEHYRLRNPPRSSFRDKLKNLFRGSNKKDG